MSRRTNRTNSTSARKWSVNHKSCRAIAMLLLCLSIAVLWMVSFETRVVSSGNLVSNYINTNQEGKEVENDIGGDSSLEEQLLYMNHSLESEAVSKAQSSTLMTLGLDKDNGITDTDTHKDKLKVLEEAHIQAKNASQPMNDATHLTSLQVLTREILWNMTD
eukprot:13087857-Ditylum_brightwellii.AAC.1